MGADTTHNGYLFSLWLYRIIYGQKANKYTGVRYLNYDKVVYFNKRAKSSSNLKAEIKGKHILVAGTRLTQIVLSPVEIKFGMMTI